MICIREGGNFGLLQQGEMRIQKQEEGKKEGRGAADI